jgi:hypothetical protein
MSFSEGKPFYRKSLKTPHRWAFMMSFPKEEKEIKPSPKPKEEEHTTEYEIPSNPSSGLFAIEPPTKGYITP